MQGHSVPGCELWLAGGGVSGGTVESMRVITDELPNGDFTTEANKRAMNAMLQMHEPTALPIA